MYFCVLCTAVSRASNANGDKAEIAIQSQRLALYTSVDAGGKDGLAANRLSTCLLWVCASGKENRWALHLSGRQFLPRRLAIGRLRPISL